MIPLSDEDDDDARGPMLISLKALIGSSSWTSSTSFSMVLQSVTSENLTALRFLFLRRPLDGAVVAVADGLPVRVMGMSMPEVGEVKSVESLLEPPFKSEN